jgi:hypothetical protein
VDRATARDLGNRLLNSFPRRIGRELAAQCESVELVSGSLLLAAGDTFGAVYFPLDCSVALMAPGVREPGLGVALVGNEGMTGIAVVLGSRSSGLDHRVHVPGPALRLPRAAVMRELRDSPAVRSRLGHYAETVMRRIARSSVCARFHRVDARLATLLLATADRAVGAGFVATHESLAVVLGVRRVGITNAASRLQGQGMIRYRRGQVQIVDRAGLQAAACACYAADLASYDELLGPLP